jgi:peptide/nickel transport system permease protein
MAGQRGALNRRGLLKVHSSMTRYLLKRLIAAIVTLFVASIVVFSVMEILPGDPAQLMLGMEATPEALNALREQMGLNQPVLTRYFSWMGGLLVGDFGRSMTYSSPVIEIIAERMVVTLPLAVISLILATIIGVPVGVYAASRRGSSADVAIMGTAQLGIALPSFWFALILVYVFAVGLRLVPAGGFPGWSAGIWPATKALILPSVALALPSAAIFARVTRTSLLNVLGEDYIRTARAKGMPKRYVLWRHAVRNALIPVITIIGIQFGFLITGVIVVENVFYLPGLGRLVYQAITQRDLIVVEGVVMLIVAAIIAINLLVDLSYAIVDPRLRTRE